MSIKNHDVTSDFQHAKELSFVLPVGYFVDSTFNTIYIYQNSLAVDGGNLGSILTAGGIWLIYFFGMLGFTRWGVSTIPTITPHKTRIHLFTAWVVFCGSITIASSWITVSYLGLDGAQNEFIKHTVQTTNETADTIKQAVRQAESLQSPVISAMNAGKKMSMDEQKSGSVCGVGQGRGECAQIISNLTRDASTTNDQINESKARTAPLIRRIEERQDRLRRLSENKNMPFDKRVNEMQRIMAFIVEDINNLKRQIPLSALQTAVESFSRELSHTGITPIGATRIRAQFFPISEQIRYALGDVKEATELHIEPIANPTEYDIITGGAQAIVPVIAFGVGISAIPFLLCLFTVIATGRKHDTDNLALFNSGRKQS